MKRFILLIAPVLIAVTIIIMVLGAVLVRYEEDRLMDDLKRKAVSVADGMELSARYVLLNKDAAGAERLVKKFQKKERVQGGAVYDAEGKLIAITERLKGWKEEGKPQYQGVISKKAPSERLSKFNKYYVYSYVAPVLDDKDNVIGLVEIIYDTSYVFMRTVDFWKTIMISLGILLAVLLGLIFFIERRFFSSPIGRLTKWFKHYQKGETEEMAKIEGEGGLGELASEVQQVALGLKIAKKAITEDARQRLKEEDLWTEAKLRDLIRSKLGDSSFIVVSNREPFMHVTDKTNGKVSLVKPASGVVTAIDPILRSCGGVWVATGSGDADKNFVNAKDKLGVPEKDGRYILKRIWLSKEEEQGFYLGFSNEGLWPLCHITHTRPIFRESDWLLYKQVNRKFADSIIEELPAKNPFVFIQDYHFTLLGRMIKEKRPDAIIALFWHIPWPNPEVFSICPYQQEILDGMLGCDLIGFHVQYHCNNFLDTANRLLECRADMEKFSIVRLGKETIVRPFPISIDDSYFKDPGPLVRQRAEEIKKELGLSNKIVAMGVDRIDYTKGIAERILAVDRFLEKYPQYIRKFVFIQLAAPSRTDIKRYHDLVDEIEELVKRKNDKYRQDGWEPIIYLKRYFTSEEIKPYFKLSDMCLVSSLHDGMNLVAKEYVASKDDLRGALILSKFTGASRELSGAVLINPYSIEEFADAIKTAAEMEPEEKKKRMEGMRLSIMENNVYKWAAGIINELTALKKDVLTK